MKKIVTLTFPQKPVVEADEVFLRVKGYSIEIACSKMSDDWWNSLPRPLPIKPFKLFFSEGDWETYLDYLPEFRATECKGLDACILELQQDPRLASFHPDRIESAFRHYWADDQRPEWVWYSEADAIATANEMIEDFVDDCLASDIELIMPRDEIAERVAKGTGLEVVVKPQEWHFPRYIDGGTGFGYLI